MKEININIEGYNVNGICVGCLNYDRKMFYCEGIKECFKLLGDIEVPDGLMVQVCWECLAAVQAARRFRAQILKSYDILIEYSNRHTFLNSPSDLTVHARCRLTCVGPELQAAGLEEKPPDDVDTSWLKEETKEEVGEIAEAEVKSETECFDAEFSQDPEPSSEDDIQLSKLKKKKDKRSKRGRKWKEDTEVKTTMEKPKKSREEILEAKRIASKERYMKIKCDPILNEMRRRKDKKNYIKNKNNKKYLNINQRSVQEQKKQREKWRIYSSKHYEKKKEKQIVEVNVDDDIEETEAEDGGGK